MQLHPGAVKCLLVGVALRVLLIVLGCIQDAYFAVNYTDIDYDVFSDAASFMLQGKSPFDRSTYRYSPLLAAILVPNAWFREWGKVLFASADIVAGILVADIVGFESGERAQLWSVALWLFNPYTATISTRGSCDVLVVLMLLFMLKWLRGGRYSLAAAMYGLAVHFRIYPAIYAPSIALFVWRQELGNRKKAAKNPQSSLPPRTYNVYTHILSPLPKLLWYGLVATTTFSALTAAFTHLYGRTYLNEALLYHATRKDIRHNFSVYYYHLYLSSSPGATRVAQPEHFGNLYLKATPDKATAGLPFVAVIPSLSKTYIQPEGSPVLAHRAHGDPSAPGTAQGDPSSLGTAQHDPSSPGTAQHDPSSPGTAQHDPSSLGTAQHDPSSPGTAQHDPSSSGTAQDNPSSPGTAQHDPSSSGSASVASSLRFPDVGFLAFVPQVLLVLLLSVLYCRHLPQCWLLVTHAFVAFNKVCTAQYFVWYFCLLPLVMAHSRWPPQRQLLWAAALWLLTQLHWLYWAYGLEFLGQPTFLFIWIASIMFLIANAFLMVQFMVSFKPTRAFAAAQPINDSMLKKKA